MGLVHHGSICSKADWKTTKLLFKSKSEVVDKTDSLDLKWEISMSHHEFNWRFSTPSVSEIDQLDNLLSFFWNIMHSILDIKPLVWHRGSATHILFLK
jgi:hypothetical protein